MDTTITTEPDFLDAQGLLRLMTWLSPAFPVGSFSYSQGIEYAVEAGLIADRGQAEEWIAAMLRRGSLWVEAGLFLAAHRAARQGAGLAAVVEWAAALRGTAEIALEARAQGMAFLAAVQACWPDPVFAARLPALGSSPSYSVVVATAAACAGIGEAAALCAFLLAAATNLVSAAVRLVPLGQTDGQRVTANLSGIVPEVVETARACPFEELGSATPMIDWTSMMHETQYTRLFRS